MWHKNSDKQLAHPLLILAYMELNVGNLVPVEFQAVLVWFRSIETCHKSQK